MDYLVTHTCSDIYTNYAFTYVGDTLKSAHTQDLTGMLIGIFSIVLAIVMYALLWYKICKAVTYIREAKKNGTWVPLEKKKKTVTPRGN